MRTEAEKQSRRKYLATTKGKATAARSWAKYRASEKYRQAAKRGQKKYQQTFNGRKVAVAAVTRHRQLHPEQNKAQCRLHYAVRTGKITRQPCVVCGSMVNLHAHHHDYSKPLEVMWLCQEHHFNQHGKRKVG